MPSVVDPSRGPSQLDSDDDDWAADIEGVDREEEEDDDDERDHDDEGTTGTQNPAHLELSELESNDDVWAEDIDDPAAAEEQEEDGKRRAEVRKPDAGVDGGRWAAGIDPLSVAAGASPSLRGAAAAEYASASFRVAVAAAAATTPSSAEEEDIGRRGRPAWHSPDGGGDEDSRREMVEIITTLLTSRKRSGRPPSQKWIAELPHKARRLEEALYLRAPSLEAYMDQKTLKARLATVATDIAARFRERKRRSSSAEGAVACVGVDAGTFSSARPPPPGKSGKWGGGTGDGGRPPSTSGIGAAVSVLAVPELRPPHWRDAAASFLGGADGRIAAAAYGDGGDGSAIDIAARFWERKRKRRNSPAEGAVAGVGFDAGTLSSTPAPPAKMGKWGGGMGDGGRLPSASGIGAVVSASAVSELRPPHRQDAAASFLGGADGKIAAAAYGDGDGSAFETLKDRILNNIREQRRLLLGMKGDGFGDPLDAPGGIPGGGGASTAAGLQHMQVSSVDFGRIMMPEALALMRSNPFALGADKAHTGTEQIMEAVRAQKQMLLVQKQQENVVRWCKTAKMQQQQEGGGQLDDRLVTAVRTGAEILPPLTSATPGAAHPPTWDGVGQDRPESPPIVPESFDW